MPTAAIVNVSLRARHEQFAADMDKMSAASKKWAGETEGAGGRVSRMLGAVGINSAVASRSFGQVATGALLASGAMDSAGQAGQALTHTLGAFLAGGPIAAGVTLLAEGYKFLAGEQAKAAEASKKRAEEDLRLLEKEKAKTDELLARIHDRELAEKSEATGTPVAELKIRDEIAALERDTYAVRGAGVGQQLDRLALLRSELVAMEEKRASAQRSADIGTLSAGLDAETLRIKKDQASAEKNLADAAAEQAEIEKKNREQWRAGEEIVRNMEEARLRSVNGFIAAQERLLGITADMLPYQDILQKREEAILGGLNDQVAALDAILERKQRQAELAKVTAEAEKAAAGFAQAQAAADRQAASDAKRQDAAEARGSKGGGAGGGAGGDGGGSPGPSWGGFTGGASMGPLAAAREAKRQQRQQRRWQNHADNLAAEGRERMGATIDDFGPGGFGVDESGMNPSHQPRAPKQEMTFSKQEGSDEGAAALKALNEAALANNIAQAKVAEAARAAADATGETASKAGEVATAGQDTATAADQAAVSLAEAATAGAAAAASLVAFAPSVATLVKSLKDITDAVATMQAAVGGM